jgi:hypothetical protein
MEHPRPERPNTVSGLNAKREELLRYRVSLEAEIRKVTCDIDHLEAAIRLFNPDTSLAAFKAYIVQHRAKKGTLKRFLMGTLRDAPTPLTSAQLTDLWLEHRGLQVTGETHTVMKRRIGASLISLRAAGTLRNEGKGGRGRMGLRGGWWLKIFASPTTRFGLNREICLLHLVGPRHVSRCDPPHKLCAVPPNLTRAEYGLINCV